jgi:hypothetical protein
MKLDIPCEMGVFAYVTAIACMSWSDHGDVE